MPFLSKAQRRKFYALKRKGKMTQAKIDEWESKTPKNIPEKKGKKVRDMKRRAGKPRTEVERRVRHKKIYGKNSKVPKRGTGRRKLR